MLIGHVSARKNLTAWGMRDILIKEGAPAPKVDYLTVISILSPYELAKPILWSDRMGCFFTRSLCFCGGM